MPKAEGPADIDDRDVDRHQKILEDVYAAECARDFDRAEAVLSTAIRQQTSAGHVAHYLGELALITLAQGRYDQALELVQNLRSGSPDLIHGFPLLHRNLEACREIAAFLRSGEMIAEVPFRGHKLNFLVSGQNSEIEHFHVRGLLYETEEVDLILRFLRDGDTLLDIGANVGNHAIACAAAVPGARIHAFEPVQKCCEFLRQNVALNSLTNIEISGLGSAIGPEDGEVRILERINLASSKSTENEIGTLVPMRALRGLWPERVDFIKIDVEGLEVSILESVIDLVHRDNTRVLLECYKATVEADLEELAFLGLTPLAQVERQAVVNVLVAPKSD
ncbi:FkbM family methyltransferase [Nisaea sediminum]|uniref:FkbM family methyltransferase n=1 Tax=Nisaea sediminum TaxID=2775867 RepID=UPI00186832AB|nr:FkbM family methyltransferase [Nisaea sediminum]